MSYSNKTRCIQNALRMLRFDPGNLDGEWGSSTRNAVRRFQIMYDLDVDGIAGSRTYERLVELIKPIQQAFNLHGFKLRTDGIADNDTYNAVINFQKHHHISADGMVGPGTWKLLNTFPKRPSNASLLKLARIQGLFKYLVLPATIGFDCDIPIMNTKQITMIGRLSLKGTLGNDCISMDLNRGKYSGHTIYSDSISADLNVFQKTSNITKALSNIGIKIGELDNSALRVKFLNGSTLNNFTVILEYSYSVDGVILYESLEIQYRHFENYQNNRISIQPDTIKKAMLVLGLIVVCVALPQTLGAMVVKEVLVFI